MELKETMVGLSVKVVANNHPELTKDSQHKLMHGVIASVDTFLVDKQEHKTLTVAILSPMFGWKTLASIGTIPTNTKPYVQADSIVDAANKELASTKSNDVMQKVLDNMEKLTTIVAKHSKQLEQQKKAPAAKKTATKKAAAEK